MVASLTAFQSIRSGISFTVSVAVSSPSSSVEPASGYVAAVARCAVLEGGDGVVADLAGPLVDDRERPVDEPLVLGERDRRRLAVVVHGVVVGEVDEDGVDPPLEVAARAELDGLRRRERIVDVEALALLIGQLAHVLAPVLHEVLDRRRVGLRRPQQQLLDRELPVVLVDLEAARPAGRPAPPRVLERQHAPGDLVEVHVADLDVDEPEAELVDVDLEVVAFVVDLPATVKMRLSPL